MTPQELKNSILQLAIQGKLVEQRPEEGTAEELFARIQEEKQRLIKEGKIKKEKPLPEITEDEKLFDIPESWMWVRLTEFATLHNGRAYKQNELLLTGKYPVLRVGNLFTNNQWYYSDFELEPEKYCEFGDLLYSWSASFGPHIWKGSKAIYHYHIWKIDYSPYVDRSYLFYMFLAATEQIKRSGHGLAMIHVTKVGMEKRPFPLPPLAEQKRIVAKIEELLPYIDRYEQAWSKLEQFNSRFPEDMKKSLLQYAIQGKLVEQRPEEGTAEELFAQIQEEKQRLIKARKIKKEKSLPAITDDEKPFEIPESWMWVRFLSVVDIATNLVSPIEYKGYMHIAPDNIEKASGHLLKCRTVEEDKVASSNHLFFKGQIIYSKIRPLLRKAVIAPFDGLCSADMYPLNTSLDKKFLLYYLLSDGFNMQIAEIMSSRVKMPKINQTELGKVFLPLPPLAEQKRIVEKLEQLLPLCERLK